MKRAVPPAFFLGLALTAFGACSLTTDLDGFTNGAVDAGPKSGDGGTPVDGAVSPGVDAAPPVEAGMEASVPCSDKPVSVCEEFQTDEKANGWMVTQVGGSTIGPATAPWGEHGLLVTIPKVDAGEIPNALWEKKWPTTVSTVSFDIDLQYDQIPTNVGEYHNIFGVRLDHGTTFNIVYLSIGTTSIGYAVQDFPGHDGDIDYHGVNLTPNVRHHVHFEVAVGGASRLVVDAAPEADNPTPAFLQAGQPTLALGISLSGVPTTPMTMGYAHLVFSAE